MSSVVTIGCGGPGGSLDPPHFASQHAYSSDYRAAEYEEAAAKVAQMAANIFSVPSERGDNKKRYDATRYAGYSPEVTSRAAALCFRDGGGNAVVSVVYDCFYRYVAHYLMSLRSMAQPCSRSCDPHRLLLSTTSHASPSGEVALAHTSSLPLCFEMQPMLEASSYEKLASIKESQTAAPATAELLLLSAALKAHPHVQFLSHLCRFWVCCLSKMRELNDVLRRGSALQRSPSFPSWVLLLVGWLGTLMESNIDDSALDMNEESKNHASLFRDVSDGGDEHREPGRKAHRQVQTMITYARDDRPVEPQFPLGTPSPKGGSESAEWWYSVVQGYLAALFLVLIEADRRHAAVLSAQRDSNHKATTVTAARVNERGGNAKQRIRREDEPGEEILGEAMVAGATDMLSQLHLFSSILAEPVIQFVSLYYAKRAETLTQHHVAAAGGGGLGAVGSTTSTPPPPPHSSSSSASRSPLSPSPLTTSFDIVSYVSYASLTVQHLRSLCCREEERAPSTRLLPAALFTRLEQEVKASLFPLSSAAAANLQWLLLPAHFKALVEAPVVKGSVHPLRQLWSLLASMNQRAAAWKVLLEAFSKYVKEEGIRIAQQPRRLSKDGSSLMADHIIELMRLRRFLESRIHECLLEEERAFTQQLHTSVIGILKNENQQRWSEELSFLVDGVLCFALTDVSPKGTAVKNSIEQLLLESSVELAGQIVDEEDLVTAVKAVLRQCADMVTLVPAKKAVCTVTQSLLLQRFLMSTDITADDDGSHASAPSPLVARLKDFTSAVVEGSGLRCTTGFTNILRGAGSTSELSLAYDTFLAERGEASVVSSSLSLFYQGLIPSTVKLPAVVLPRVLEQSMRSMNQFLKGKYPQQRVQVHPYVSSCVLSVVADSRSRGRVEVRGSTLQCAALLLLDEHSPRGMTVSALQNALVVPTESSTLGNEEVEAVRSTLTSLLSPQHPFLSLRGNSMASPTAPLADTDVLTINTDPTFWSGLSSSSSPVHVVELRHPRLTFNIGTTTALSGGAGEMRSSAEERHINKGRLTIAITQLIKRHERLSVEELETMLSQQAADSTTADEELTASVSRLVNFSFGSKDLKSALEQLTHQGIIQRDGMTSCYTVC